MIRLLGMVEAAALLTAGQMFTWNPLPVFTLLLLGCVGAAACVQRDALMVRGVKS